MLPVIYKAQVIVDCGKEPCCGGNSDGLFRMGWFSISGKDPRAPSATDYQYVRSRLTHILCLPKEQEFDICFKDTDGQRKLIKQDEDLEKAVTILEDGLCKLFVCLKDLSASCA